jgi:hypothetical protein
MHVRYIRPVVLKPGVTTHLCVAKIFQCVSKIILNYLKHSTSILKDFAQGDLLIIIIRLLLSVSLFPKVITLRASLSPLTEPIECVRKISVLQKILTHKVSQHNKVENRSIRQSKHMVSQKQWTDVKCDTTLECLFLRRNPGGPS